MHDGVDHQFDNDTNNTNIRSERSKRPNCQYKDYDHSITSMNDGGDNEVDEITISQIICYLMTQGS